MVFETPHVVEEEQAKERKEQKELKEIQSFIQEMNSLWLNNWPNRWETNRTIYYEDWMLQIESMLWDWGSFVNFSLVKNGKEIFVYNMSADILYEWRGEDRPVWITMKINGKTLSYSGDMENKHWLYNNFHLLEEAKKYKEEIEEIINTRNAIDALKEEVTK